MLYIEMKTDFYYKKRMYENTLSRRGGGGGGGAGAAGAEGSEIAVGAAAVDDRRWVFTGLFGCFRFLESNLNKIK